MIWFLKAKKRNQVNIWSGKKTIALQSEKTIVLQVGKTIVLRVEDKTALQDRENQ